MLHQVKKLNSDFKNLLRDREIPGAEIRDSGEYSNFVIQIT